VRGAVEERLSAALPSNVAPACLHEAMRYAVLGGGKRIRALLAVAAGQVSDAAPVRLEIVAAALEIIHAYSLVHDDLPSMDNDVLRRGKPTVHIQYDEATAILVGDSLNSLAFQLLAEHRLADDARDQLTMIALLAHAAGSRGMAGGQAIDLASEAKTLSLPELEHMHIHKTGALIRAAVLLGARCGRTLPAAELEQLDHYAKNIGLAFQVVDDLLDAQSSTATLGKTAGKDAKTGKATYVSIMGVSAARAMASELHGKAITALAPFGQRGERLRQLAELIVSRQS
jgi:farnesyl diphosphate synthase